jgi:hypothetical protein
LTPENFLMATSTFAEKESTFDPAEFLATTA